MWSNFTLIELQNSQVFSSKQTNVLTRQKLKLDWLKSEQKTSICKPVGTGFVVSLFSVFHPLAGHAIRYE